MSAINPDFGPDPVHRLADGSTRARPMSRFELHAIFREVVLWELANGNLSARRRRRLVQYAAALRISAAEAGQLIQEARQALDAELAAQAGQTDTPRLRLVTSDQQEQSGWPTWAKLSAAVAVIATARFVFGWIVGG
jgi:hypothetical protein